MNSLRLQNQWTRSSEGWLAGVCQGLGERFDLNPGALRLIWFLSFLCLGIGFIPYFILAFIMPLEGEEERALQPKVLGVCLRLSEKLDIDVVPLRLITVFALFGSAGTILFIYVLLHFLLPSYKELQQ